MDKPAAIAARHAALDTDPDNPRLNYLLARTYGYSGLHEQSDPYRIKALNAGYPQSLLIIGYIRIEGWDGRELIPAMAENPSAAQPIQIVLQVWSAFRIMCRLGCSEELTFIFYNVPSFC